MKYRFIIFKLKRFYPYVARQPIFVFREPSGKLEVERNANPGSDGASGSQGKAGKGGAAESPGRNGKDRRNGVKGDRERFNFDSQHRN